MNKQLSNLIKIAAIAIAMVAATAIPALAQRGGTISPNTPIQIAKVTDVDVAPYLGSGNGGGDCPQGASYSAMITVDGACTVKFAWITDKNPNPPASSYTSIKFDKAGSKPYYYYFSATNANPTMSGWVGMKIIAPNQVESNHVNYSLSCNPTNTVQVNPNIKIKP